MSEPFGKSADMFYGQFGIGALYNPVCLYRVYKHSTACQTRFTTGLTTSCIVYTAGCQTGCTTG